VAGRIISMKISDGTIGNRTCDLLACSALPQPTAPLCAPTLLVVLQKITEKIPAIGSQHFSKIQTKQDSVLMLGCITMLCRNFHSYIHTRTYCRYCFSVMICMKVTQ